MVDSELYRGSLSEHFEELVSSALAHQRLPLSGLVAHYLVDLLSGFAHGDRWLTYQRDPSPLILRLASAARASGHGRRNELRKIGDFALFVSGYLPESLSRRGAAPSYYIALGELAYGSLSLREGGVVSDVFEELSRKFSALVDVIGEVSERTGLTTNRDLLRLYERWLTTGSSRLGQLLIERGVVPSDPASVQ